MIVEDFIKYISLLFICAPVFAAGIDVNYLNDETAKLRNKIAYQSHHGFSNTQIVESIHETVQRIYSNYSNPKIEVIQDGRERVLKVEVDAAEQKAPSKEGPGRTFSTKIRIPSQFSGYVDNAVSK